MRTTTAKESQRHCWTRQMKLSFSTEDEQFREEIAGFGYKK